MLLILLDKFFLVNNPAICPDIALNKGFTPLIEKSSTVLSTAFVDNRQRIRRRFGLIGRRPRQYMIMRNPKAIPPKWAKCATPDIDPVNPA